MEKHIIASRHSLKKKEHFYDFNSKKYPGLIWRGIGLAKQSAKDIISELEQTPHNSVFFLGAVSDEVRTHSTARIYGAEMKKLLADNKGYVVVTEEDMAGNRQQSYRETIGQLKKIIDDNPDKRVVVDVPLFVKQFSMQRIGWVDGAGNRTPYSKKILGKAGGDLQAAFRYWVEHQGEPIDGVEGPKPVEVAKDYQKGLDRLEHFVRKYVPDRPLVTGFVGHNYDATAFLTYIAGGGKVDLATYDRIRGGEQMVKEAEIGTVKIAGENATLTFRKKKHSSTLEKLVAAIGVIGILGVVFSLSGVTGNVVGASYNSPLGIISVVVFLTAMLLYSVIRELRA
ncbi:MAG: hypothetical protein V1866_03090 [archaeon]